MILPVFFRSEMRSGVARGDTTSMEVPFVKRSRYLLVG